MRHQGKISNWKAERGYGFITADQDKQKVFFHIKALADRRRRPSLDDSVSYELTYDQLGRAQAIKLAFADDRADSPATRRNTPSPLPLLIAGSFLAVVAACTFLGKLPITVLALYLAVSVIAFIAYAGDKSAARSDRWRLPENSLHLLALLGGWPGALIAQNRLRHKSRKASFLLVFRATALLNCGALGLLLALGSGQALRTALG